jgi:hypothetical protein
LAQVPDRATSRWVYFLITPHCAFSLSALKNDNFLSLIWPADPFRIGVRFRFFDSAWLDLVAFLLKAVVFACLEFVPSSAPDRG